MAKSSWKGVTIAETDEIEHVEGNAYFPVSAIDMSKLEENPGFGTTFCHWKGHADYYDVVVDGERLEGAAWRYNAPYGQAENIRDHIAFWKGVEVMGGPEGPGYVEPQPSRRDGKTGWEALCWLLRHPLSQVLSEADVQANTDLAGDALREAWQENDVQRYATRYRWTLEDGEDGIVLRQSDGEPVSIE
jgi:uncharacterized protein (DUF427 family)